MTPVHASLFSPETWGRSRRSVRKHGMHVDLHDSSICNFDQGSFYWRSGLSRTAPTVHRNSMSSCHPNLDPGPGLVTCSLFWERAYVTWLQQKLSRAARSFVAERGRASVLAVGQGTREGFHKWLHEHNQLPRRLKIVRGCTYVGRYQQP